MKKPRSRPVAILHKELVLVVRDPRTLAMTLFMPVLLLVLYGYGVSTDIRDIPMVILDQDRSGKSREFIGEFVNSRFFLPESYAGDFKDIDHAIDAGRAKVGLVIPPDFGKRIVRGEVVQVFVAVDGSEPNTASISISYVGSIVATYNRQILVRRLDGRSIPWAQEPIDVRPRVWYNPELRSVNFIVPGLIAVILMTTSALLTSVAIARERELGTIEPLFASPIKSSELMLGKIGAYTLISFADIVLVILVGTLWFGVPLRGSATLLMVMSAIFLLSSLGLGLLISARSTSQQSAVMLTFLTTMIPGLLLSGFLFPIASMPRPIQLLTYVIPARYFLVVVRGIFLKGVGVAALWPQMLPMAFLGLLLFVLSIRSFKKQIG